MEEDYQFVELGSAEIIPEDKGQFLDFRGFKIAVFKHKGRFFAIDNRCRHQGGPLCTGDIEDISVDPGTKCDATVSAPAIEAAGVTDEAAPPTSSNLSGSSATATRPAVVCPWHGWSFFLDNGDCHQLPGLKTVTYPTRVVNGMLYVGLKLTTPSSVSSVEPNSAKPSQQH
eukprot:TRINITY_DN19416_c0_g1_i1.p1 TRINITY_DN19416_c0_g1~~TRINITY_DN19416_c0_g1_i1.p1  ORF type:complete len:171 (+),score=17.77 TRINITY_DN19416_c0_g1_i1:80-592(+)